MKQKYRVLLEIPTDEGGWYPVRDEFEAESPSDAVARLCSIDWDKADPFGPAGLATVTAPDGTETYFEVTPVIRHEIDPIDKAYLEKMRAEDEG